jgi:hypothetical protein
MAFEVHFNEDGNEGNNCDDHGENNEMTRTQIAPLSPLTSSHSEIP